MPSPRPVPARRLGLLAAVALIVAACGGGTAASVAPGTPTPVASAPAGDGGVSATDAAPTVAFKDVEVGAFSACGLLVTGQVACWGDGRTGIVGDGVMSNDPTYGIVPGVSDAVQIAVGEGHGCALVKDGTVTCWGGNGTGQLGTQDGFNAAVATKATKVAGVAGVTKIAASGMNTCALLSDKTLVCWGNDQFGQLTKMIDFGSEWQPTPVKRIKGAVDVAAGSSICAVMDNGTVLCWGDNQLGELGRGTTTPDRDPEPGLVKGIDSAVAISGGQASFCVVLKDATVKCWGWNKFGQVGDGSTTDRSVPVAVPGLSGVKAVSVGGGTACALLQDATIQCWGMNTWGQSGDGGPVTKGAEPISLHLTPVAVVNLTGVAEVSSGGLASCAVKQDGTAWCWGANSLGGLGDGTTDPTSTPVQVKGL